MSAASQPHYVYRHFDADDRLLYVGVTMRPNDRPYERRDRPWFDQSARVEIDGPMPQDRALLAERTAIRDESPLHNVYRNNGNKTAAYRYFEAQAQARRARFDSGELVSIDPDDFYGLSVEECEQIDAAISPFLDAALRKAAS